MNQNTVYYLVHKDSLRRIRYYKSLAGARIAQRARNRLLGFHQRIERVNVDNWEEERCVLSSGAVETATYCIVEDTLDRVEITC